MDPAGKLPMLRKLEDMGATIRSAIMHRINTGKWPSGSAKSRQRHWLCKLKRQVKAHLTEEWKNSLIAAFDYIVKQGRIPVSRSI